MFSYWNSNQDAGLVLLLIPDPKIMITRIISLLVIKKKIFSNRLCNLLAAEAIQK